MRATSLSDGTRLLACLRGQGLSLPALIAIQAVAMIVVLAIGFGRNLGLDEAVRRAPELH